MAILGTDYVAIRPETSAFQPELDAAVTRAVGAVGTQTIVFEADTAGLADAEAAITEVGAAAGDASAEVATIGDAALDAGSELEGGFTAGGAAAEALGEQVEQVAGGAMAGFSEVVGNISGRLAQLPGPAGRAGGALGSLGAAGTGAVAGIGAVVGAVTLAVGSFQSFALEVRRFQQLTGTSAEEASRFVAVLDDFQISGQQGANALFLLGRNIETNEQRFADLGVEIARNVDGTANLTETVLNIADAFDRTEDPAEKAAIAMGTLGRQGRELIPLLNEGRQGLAAFFADAERQVINQEEVDKARELQLAIDDLQDAGQVLARTVGSELVPILVDMLEAVQPIAEGLGDMLGAVNDLLEPVGGLGNALRFLFDPINAIQKAFEPQGWQEVRDAFLGIRQEVEGTGEAFATLAEAQAFVDGLTGATKEQAQAFLDDLVAMGSFPEVSADAGSAQGALADELALVNEELAAQEQAIDDVLAAQLSLIDSSLAAKEAQINFKDSVVDLNETLKDEEATHRERRQALIDAEQAALALAEANIRLAADTAAANHETLDQEEQNKIVKDTFRDLADDLAPGSALRRHLRDYADGLKGIPPDVKTKITADITTEDRPVLNFLSDAARAHATIRAELLVSRSSGLASGGFLAPGETALVGEEGFEVARARPGGGVDIFSNQDSRSLLGVSGVNITVNEVANDPEATARSVAWRLGEAVGL